LGIFPRSRLAATPVALVAICILSNHPLSMYADDNNDVLVPNNPPGVRDLDAQQSATWARGDARYGNPDGTNISTLMSGKPGSLQDYLKTPKVFKCPSDRSTTLLADQKRYPRLRSYSMNGLLGTRGSLGDAWKGFTRADINSGPRQDLIIFVDTHPDSIRDCTFLIPFDVNREHFEKLPASHHGGKGVLSFHDGRATIHKWQEKSTRLPITGNDLWGGNVFGSKDWDFMYRRMTRGPGASFGHDF